MLQSRIPQVRKASRFLEVSKKREAVRKDENRAKAARQRWLGCCDNRTCASDQNRDGSTTERTHRSQRGHQRAPASGWKRSGLQGGRLRGSALGRCCTSGPCPCIGRALVSRGSRGGIAVARSGRRDRQVAIAVSRGRKAQQTERKEPVSGWGSLPHQRGCHRSQERKARPGPADRAGLATSPAEGCCHPARQTGVVQRVRASRYSVAVR